MPPGMKIKSNPNKRDGSCTAIAGISSKSILVRKTGNALSSQQVHKTHFSCYTRYQAPLFLSKWPMLTLRM